MEIAFAHVDTFMDDVNNQQAIIDLADFLCAPGMGVVYRVKVPNGEGSSNH